MRVGAAWALAFLLVPTLSGCVGPLRVDSAEWQPGYRFATELSGSGWQWMNVSVRDSLLASSQSVGQAGPQPWNDYTVRLADYAGPGAAVPLYLGVNNDIGGLAAFQKVDLAPVDASARYRKPCPSCPAQDIELQFTPGPSSWPMVRFPLEEGSTWTWSLQEAGVAAQMQAQVEGLEQLEGPIGPVEALRIRHSLTDAGASALSAALQQQAARATDAPVAVQVRIEFTVLYAPELHAIARTDRVTDTEVRIGAADVGHGIVVVGTSHVHIVERLVRADLAASPPMEMADLLVEAGQRSGQRSFELRLESVAVQEAPPLPPVEGEMPVSMRLQAPDTPANATAGQSIVVSAEPGPEAWTVHDAAGTLVAAGGPAPSFAFVPKAPGLFLVEAFAGDLQARAVVAAYWDGVADRGCTLLATAVAASPCGAVRVDVGPGSAQATVEAIIEGTLPGEAGGIQLDPGELQAKLGHVSAHAPRTGDSATVLLAPPEGLPAGTLEAAYTAHLGIGQSVRYRVRVDPADPATSGPGGTRLGEDVQGLVAAAQAMLPVTVRL